jgi:hypothetical protein
MGVLAHVIMMEYVWMRQHSPKKPDKVDGMKKLMETLKLRQSIPGPLKILAWVHHAGVPMIGILHGA